MLILLIASVILSFLCVNITVAMSKTGIKTDRDMDVVRTAISLGIGVSAALYLIASFNLGPSGDADVWDYGKMTAEGYLNIGAQIVGTIGVAENVVAAAFLLVRELKGNKLSGDVERTNSHRTVEKREPEIQIHAQTSGMPQNKVPAWKQVEMEKQDK